MAVVARGLAHVVGGGRSGCGKDRKYSEEKRDEAKCEMIVQWSAGGVVAKFVRKNISIMGSTCQRGLLSAVLDGGAAEEL